MVVVTVVVTCAVVVEVLPGVGEGGFVVVVAGGEGGVGGAGLVVVVTAGGLVVVVDPPQPCRVTPTIARTAAAATQRTFMMAALVRRARCACVCSVSLMLDDGLCKDGLIYDVISKKIKSRRRSRKYIAF